MKAVMYGGGNIGRGFIGMLFSQSGYEVTFVDVVPAVVEHLNKEHCYPVRIISDEGHEDHMITNVDAVGGNDPEAVAAAIADADIMATAVGAKILKFIAPNIALGIKKRFANGGRPLDIIVCENLMNADKVLEGLIKEHLNEEEQHVMDEKVGLAEASIGRMVPVQTDEMKDGNPMRVCVEGYRFLPVDKAAFKGGIPDIKGLTPFSPFDYFIKRKLYLHNRGHAVCAYLGGYKGLEYIYEAIDDPEILAITQNAMLESAMGLSKKYDVPLNDIVLHMQDLLCRFTNAALKDTCKRVGGDPLRKLQRDDRLIGSALVVLEQGTCPSYIPVGIAGAMYRYFNEDEKYVQSEESAMSFLKDACGLDADGELARYTISMYRRFLDGEDISQIRRAAQKHKKSTMKEIV